MTRHFWLSFCWNLSHNSHRFLPSLPLVPKLPLHLIVPSVLDAASSWLFSYFSPLFVLATALGKLPSDLKSAEHTHSHENMEVRVETHTNHKHAHGH